MWDDQADRRPLVIDGRGTDVRAALLALREHRIEHRNDEDELPPTPASPGAAARIRRYAEPLIKERGANPNGQCWHLMSVLDEMREGLVAPARKIFPWNREQVEALWDNLVNGWPLGALIAVDLTGQVTAPWPDRFGPYPTTRGFGKRTLLLSGAEKLSALAWSLAAEPPTPIQQRFAPEETAIWSRQTLVVDADLRRVRFVWGAYDRRHQMPVQLLPDASSCLKAQNAMELTPIAREWLNRTARRLMETYLSVHLFPWCRREDAEAMMTNLRQIGSL